jgi:hypothetical protein
MLIGSAGGGVARLQDLTDVYVGVRSGLPAANAGKTIALITDTAEELISNGTSWLPLNGARSASMRAVFSGSRNTVSFAFTKFICDTTVSYDYGSNYSSSTGLYTCPYTGVYAFQGRIRLEEGVQYDNFGISIDKQQDENSNIMNWRNTSTGASNGANRHTFTVERFEKFTAGDQLRLFYYWSNGNTYHIVGADMAISLLHIG